MSSEKACQSSCQIVTPKELQSTVSERKVNASFRMCPLHTARQNMESVQAKDAVNGARLVAEEGGKRPPTPWTFQEAEILYELYNLSSLEWSKVAIQLAIRMA